MVGEALKVAEKLAAEGVEIEVIDPRTIFPLDLDTVVDSVRKTSRVVVAHEAVLQGGVGAEIAARIQESAFEYLDAPVLRVGAPFAPVPAGSTLEDTYTPGADDIETAVRRSLT
jgi:pyruvate dehydrogenase E1 component beta subunit